MKFRLNFVTQTEDDVEHFVEKQLDIESGNIVAPGSKMRAGEERYAVSFDKMSIGTAMAEDIILSVRSKYPDAIIDYGAIPNTIPGIQHNPSVVLSYEQAVKSRKFRGKSTVDVEVDKGSLNNFVSVDYIPTFKSTNGLNSLVVETIKPMFFLDEDRLLTEWQKAEFPTYWHYAITPLEEIGGDTTEVKHLAEDVF